MIKLTNEQCERINVVREDALKKIYIYECGIEFPYYHCQIKPQCERIDWINLIRQKIDQCPFKSETLSTLSFNNKSELQDFVLEYLSEIERIMVDEFSTGVHGMEQILEDYGKTILKILNLNYNVGDSMLVF